jgi:hypothetical protein
LRAPREFVVMFGMWGLKMYRIFLSIGITWAKYCLTSQPILRPVIGTSDPSMSSWMRRRRV